MEGVGYCESVGLEDSVDVETDARCGCAHPFSMIMWTSTDV